MTFATFRTFFVATALAALAGCRPPNQFQEPPPAKVDVAQPEVRAVAEQMDFTGSTRALATVELRAKVSGYLREIKFLDGAYVNEGDLLFVIEQEPFQQELEARQADLLKAQANQQLAEANIARTEKLQQQNAATQQQIDIAKAERSTSSAGVAAAESAVKLARLNMSYTEVRAPISGQIGRHLVDRGNLVQASTMPLATIEAIDPIHVYFYVSESDVLRFMTMVREGQIPDPTTKAPELKMGLLTDKDYPYTGHLDFRALGVDPTTGTVMRRAIFKNENRQLIPGLFVRLRADLGAPRDRVLVEERAIGSEQRGDFLLIVDDQNVVQRRPVKLGMAVGNLRVIDEGLKPGEWVIVNGLQRARPSAKVDPQKPKTAPVAATKQAGEEPTVNAAL